MKLNLRALTGLFILFLPRSLHAQLEEASIVFAQNQTDRGYEVVFLFEGGEEGIKSLLVLDSMQRVVIDNSSEAGLREYLFETPEKLDWDALRLLYPEGSYSVQAITLSNLSYSTKIELSHQLPAHADLLEPPSGARNVPLNISLEWAAVAEATKYIVLIGSEDSSDEIMLVLQASVTTLNLPKGFLKPNTEYEAQIGVIAVNGNRSFTESTFTTAN